MNDEIADELIIPAIEEVARRLRLHHRSDAVVYGITDTHERVFDTELQAFWEWDQMEVADFETRAARDAVAAGATKVCLAVAGGYRETDEAFELRTPGAEGNAGDIIFAVSVDLTSGLDLCGLFFRFDIEGTLHTDEDILIMENPNGTTRLNDGGVGWLLMQTMLEATE